MTDQITVPRATWDALQQALKDISEESYDKGAVECANHALTAAASVSHANPETTPPPEGGAITSESAANAVSAEQYSIDADPQGIRARVVSAVVGAMAYGASNTNKPPEGHWLNEVWDIARAEANRVQPQAQGESRLPERDTNKPAEEQGLFRKFDVTRTDGSSSPGGKHHGCEYFVLDVDHDQHAKAALQAYAVACASTHPQLSADLKERYGAHPQATDPQEAIAWEATTPGYIKYVTDRQYRSYSETAKRWYKPYKCSSCQAQSTEPAGWRLVPVEPTPEMLIALINEWDSVGGRTMYENYRAMLAAAPEAP